LQASGLDNSDVTLQLNASSRQSSESGVEVEVSPYALFDLTRAIAASRTPDDIYNAALDCLRDCLAVDKSSILLFDPDGVMRFKAWHNLSDEYRAAVEGHTPWTPETKDPEPVLVPDVREEPSLAHLCAAIEAEGIRALAFFPLTADDRLLGKFMLYYPEPHELARQEILIAKTIAAHVAFALDRHEIRQERREWREHLEAMFGSRVVGIAEVDAEGCYRLVNDRFCEIVGRSREELLQGVTSFDITFPNDMAASRLALAQLAAGEELQTLEKRYIRPDGDVVWVSTSLTSIHANDGSFKGAIAVVTDMTRRRAGEQLRRESEERLAAELAATQRLQEASSQLIREDDVTAVYETILDTATAIMGSEFASMQMLYPERGPSGELKLLAFRGFNPDAAKFWEWVRPASESTCGAALRTGRRVAVPDVRACEWMAGTDDLATYLDTGILAVQTTPLIARSGKLIGMISTHWRTPHEPTERDLRLFDVLARQAADLIERSQAQTQLSERTNLMQSITDNMSVGLVLLDTEGCIEMMNPAAEHITGYSLSDVQGRVWHDLVHDKREDGTPYPRSECVVDEAARTQQGVTGQENVFILPDGTFYNVVCNLAPVVSDGVWMGSVLDVRDVTVERQAEMALRESEEQLRAAAQLKDEFLGLVSHELRTPISTILGNGLLLERNWARIAQDDRQQALSDISSEAGKLQEIIENLLLITRMEAGHLDSEPLAMQRLIEDSIADFRRMHPNRRLSFVPADGLPPALGEPALVPLIMRNLLSNADKYSPADRPIEVSLRFDNESDSLEVAVRDHGIGLETSDLGAVFEPFFRTQRSRKYAKGMGLGLAVCKRVTEAQGGRIWVEPQEDAGLRFVFQLRAIREPELLD